MTCPRNLVGHRRTQYRVIAVVIASVLLGACSGDAEPEAGPDTPAPTGEAATDPGEQHVDLDEAVTTGEEVQQGRFALTVDGLDCDGGEDVGDVEATGRFCMLELGVTNSSDTEQSVELDRQVLLDETGTEYALSYEATQAANSDLSETIGAGESATLTLVYDIPDDARIVAARISDDVAGDGVLVDLQN